MEWTLANAPSAMPPPSHRLVLLALAPRGAQSSAVAVGYWKRAGEALDGYFVIPGVGLIGGVVAWADCLGDDFRAPVWPGTAPGGPLDNGRNKA